MQLEVTCSSSQTYCWDLLIDDYSCIPSGTVCCGNGNYCPSGQVCTGTGGSTNTCESSTTAEGKCNPSWVPSRAYLFEECTTMSSIIKYLYVCIYVSVYVCVYIYQYFISVL